VNGADAVLGQSPAKDAAIQLRLVPGGASGAAAEFFGQESVAGTPTSGKVNGLPAASGFFRMRTQDGVLAGYAVFVDYGGRTYALFAFTPESRISSYDAAFKASLGSFEKLTDRDALSVQPRRIEIVEIDRAMTVQAFTERWPSTVDPEQVAMINGMTLTDELPAGTMLKRVVGKGAPGS
jgi:predicted Zn-dependent protease